MLAVIAMAAPLYAADPCDVVFDADGSTGSLVLSYTTNNGALPRGFGLRYTVLNGDTVDIDPCAVTVPGIDPCDAIFIDYAFMDPDPCTIEMGDGHPLADPCEPGVLAPTTGVDVFSVCIGVLDHTGNKGAGPATADPLVVIPLTSTAGSVTIRISEDVTEGAFKKGRGGVVGSALTTNLPITVTVSFDCYIIGQPRYYDENMVAGPAITQANYDAWVACGKSLCWCCPHHGYGDVNGDGWINANDVSLVNNAFTAGILPPLPAAYVRCDVNHDGWINANDVSTVNNKFTAGVGQLPNACPDCP